MGAKEHASKRDNNVIVEEMKNYLESKENDHTMIQSMAHSESNPKKEIESNIDLSQEIRKLSNDQSRLTPEECKKRRRSKAVYISLLTHTHKTNTHTHLQG